MRVGQQDGVPTPKEVLAAFAEDERPGRPGPKPPRLKAEVPWEELVRVVVTTVVSPELAGDGADDELREDPDE